MYVCIHIYIYIHRPAVPPDLQEGRAARRRGREPLMILLSVLIDHDIVLILLIICVVIYDNRGPAARGTRGPAPYIILCYVILCMQ